MIRGMYVPLGHFSIYDHANQLRPSVPLSLSLSLSRSVLDPTQDSLYTTYTSVYTHEARLGRRGITDIDDRERSRVVAQYVREPCET